MSDTQGSHENGEVRKVVVDERRRGEILGLILEHLVRHATEAIGHETDEAPQDGGKKSREGRYFPLAIDEDDPVSAEDAALLRNLGRALAATEVVPPEVVAAAKQAPSMPLEERQSWLDPHVAFHPNSPTISPNPPKDS